MAGIPRIQIRKTPFTSRSRTLRQSPRACLGSRRSPTNLPERQKWIETFWILHAPGMRVLRGQGFFYGLQALAAFCAGRTGRSFEADALLYVENPGTKKQHNMPEICIDNLLFQYTISLYKRLNEEDKRALVSQTSAPGDGKIWAWQRNWRIAFAICAFYPNFC